MGVRSCGWCASATLAVFFMSACARPVPPSPEERRSWARETLARMTLEEKVGQLIFAKAWGEFVHEKDATLQDLIRAARAGRIGGVVFFKGDPLSTAWIANRLQDVAPLPLLVASDLEWGPAFRIEGATRFPSAMAVAAGGLVEDAAVQAEVTAREAQALGIHWALAPVVDVNLHPDNEVINVRSYGSDPQRVASLATAFIERAQALGLLTTAKHFPGHGATSADSHLELPVLRLARERLEEKEFVPFRAAIDAGVAAVMTAHVAVPALDGHEDRPATFSPEILEGVLRGELGFSGLIVSDALSMAAVRSRTWSGAIAVEAFQAGCDVLIVPEDPLVAWDALRRAVEDGRIAPERLDRSVSRILEAKARLNLPQKRTVDLRDVPRRVGDPRWSERIEAVASRAITLLRLEDRALPLLAEQTPRILLLSYVPAGDRSLMPSVLEEELAKRTPHVTHALMSSRTWEGELGTLDRIAGTTDAIVLASYARSAHRAQAPLEMILSRLAELRRPGTSLVLASFGNPYVLSGPLTAADALLAAYDVAEPSQRAVAAVLFGEIDIGGRLPVELGTEYPLGHGIPLERRRMELQRVDSPEEAGFSKEGIAEAMKVLHEAIEARAFPGVQVIVGRRGKIALARAEGRLTYGTASPPVTMDTLYDIASLTKVVVTTTLAMILHERGALELGRAVREYLPEFTGGGKDTVTVEDLLAHSGGLLWWKDLFKSVELAGTQRSYEDVQRDYIETISRLPLDYEPRSKSVYSDLGVLLLGEILERVSGRQLDEMAQREIFEPLAMGNTLFNPPAALRSRIAPTERDPWRGRLLQGEVHDENAFALGGVAPHAGLFSTAGDLARFAQMMLNGGVYGHARIVRADTIERFTHRAELAPESSRALGWDTPSGNSSAGRYFSADSYGHTGFTGTSLWIDPRREVFVVLLTNRVHPTRENDRIREVRRAFHDAVMKALLASGEDEIRPRIP